MASPAVDADPLPRVLAHLDTHPDVIGYLGDADHISDENQAPYPHLRITDAGSGDVDGEWLIWTDILVEVFDDLEQSTPKDTLLRIIRTVLAAIGELGKQPTPPPGMPVITYVRVEVGAAPAREPSGQRKYRAIIRVWSHP